MKVINAIPEEHRPIFLWLKYHLRRPGEACVLRWEDYDRINKVFTVRRAISARQEVDSTKTNAEHVLPCHPAFEEVMDKLDGKVGEVIFKNSLARTKSKRYTNESLNYHWKRACKKVGESIDLYSGLKHSSCSQYLNEHGLTVSELQVLTDHKRLESVERYGKVGVERKRQLMARRNVIIFPEKNPRHSPKNSAR
jgi:integrase